LHAGKFSLEDTFHITLPDPLRQYLARFAAQFNAAPDPIWVEDTSGRIAYINPPALALLGHETDQGLLGAHWSLTVSPTHYHTVELRNQNIPAPCETVLVTFAGYTVPVVMMAMPVFDENEFICIQAKLSRTPAVDRQTGPNYEHWIATHHDAIVAFDNKFIITAWNRGAEDMYGWTVADAIGRNVQDIIRLDFLDITGLQGNHFDGGSQIFYARGANVRKDGTIIQVETQLTIVRDRYGDILHFTAIIRHPD
jgi:PAS domain S-box-containing protein